MISKSGIYLDIPEAEYHADPVFVASLSSSIAKIIYNETPLHAKHAHPRLNGHMPDEKSDRAMDIGSAFHKFTLGRGRDVEMVPFDNYLKKDAKEARDAIRAAGKIPLLQSDAAKVEVLNAAAVEQLHALDRGDIFSRCHCEVTLVWEEANGVWCRARLDALPKDYETATHLIVPELKSTDGSADPETWSRRYFDLGYDLQASFYRRGLLNLLPEVRTVTMEHVVVEQNEPNAVNIVTASATSIAEADHIVDTAISLWGHCMKSGQWPGYSGGIIETANWRSVKREEKNIALLKRLMEWQAP